MVGNYPNIPSGYTAKINSTRQCKLGYEKGSLEDSAKTGEGTREDSAETGEGTREESADSEEGIREDRTDGRTREHSAETAEGTEEDSYVQLRTQR